MPDLLTQQIIAVIAELQSLPTDSLTSETTFDELAIDSLVAVALAFEIEDRFHVSMSSEDAFKMQTIADVVERVRQLQVTSEFNNEDRSRR